MAGNEPGNLHRGMAQETGSMISVAGTSRGRARTTVVVMLLAAPVLAGPIEFGLAELQRAFAARGLPAMRVATAVVPAPPESYTVQPDRVTGGDPRGLMYGLLQAAEQIRRTGRIENTRGRPAVAVRGIRMFLHNEDLEKDWYYSREHWKQYFAMLARNRFNRFNLVFAHQTNYLAPPYPFWLQLPEFPGIRAQRLTAAQRRQNLETLEFITATAAEHGVDFTLGLWEHNIQAYRKPPMTPTVDGLTRENIGPYSYAALKQILRLCPAIRSVQLRTNTESGIPEDQQLEFFRDWIFRAVREAGRPVTLDVRGWTMHPGLLKAAENAGVPLRISTKYWAEDMGRPYQPAETYPRYSYLNFLEKPRTYDFYWEIWSLGSHRLLLWGDPGYVRRAVSTFGLSGAAGFEIDAPLSQRGYGNQPGKWGIFSEAQKDRVFWTFDFERYWLFYQLWGRLSYDPRSPDSVWQDELSRRFGAAAEEVSKAYGYASKVISEIVAAHLADPNMYIWPEVNPGGLIGSYRDVLPSDWRYIARVREAVQNRLQNVASAKQTPLDTAALLDRLAQQIEQALAGAASKVPAGNDKEWRSSEPDFRVLAALARYHAKKQAAVYHLTWFEETGNPASLRAAKAELKTALEVWTRLVRLTDGLYPAQMAYGPNDVGHWKDKLPYVEHDLAWAEELERTSERFGDYEFRFDFGGSYVSPEEVPYRDYRDGPFVRRNTLMPRFQPVDPGTAYREATGYGWVGGGQRSATALPLTPYLEAVAVARQPGQLPRNVLFGDFIEGTGPQTFRVRTGEGSFEVRLLRPDGSDTKAVLRAVNGAVDVALPEGGWKISGLLVKNSNGGKRNSPAETAPKILPRPRILHTAPGRAAAGQPLTLSISARPANHLAGIRLHYRSVNQLEKFRTLEAKGAQASFTIPAEDLSGRWDLLYYFELLNTERTGWFHPDPTIETPYFVVTVTTPGSP